MTSTAPARRWHVAPPPYRLPVSELSEWFREPEPVAMAHLKLWMAQDADFPASRGGRVVRTEFIRSAFFQYQEQRRLAGLSNPPLTLLDMAKEWI